MATYYIDPTDGLDTNNGTTPTPLSGGAGTGPWKTLGKAFSGTPTINPGDRILVKRGSIIRETVNTCTFSGTKQKPIIIGAYGSGPRPIYDGSRVTAYYEWANFTTGIVDQVYQTIPFTFDPRIVIVNGEPAPRATGAGTMVEGEWWWDSGTNVVIFRRARGKTSRDYEIRLPDVLTTGRHLGIFFSGCDYVILRDFHFRHWVSKVGTQLALAVQLTTDAGRGACVGFEIRDCKFENIFDAHAILIDGTHAAHDILIERNEFVEIAQTGFTLGAVVGNGLGGGGILTSTVKFVRNSLKNVLHLGKESGAGGYEGDLCRWVSIYDFETCYIGHNRVDLPPFPRLSYDDDTAARASELVVLSDSTGSNDGSTNKIKNPIIEHNDFRGGNHQIILDTTAGGEVRYNRGYGCRADPFMISCIGAKRAMGGHGLKIHHNLFFGGYDNGAQIHQGNDVTFAHNVVAKSCGNGLMISHDFGFPTGANKKLKIYNNIFFENGQYQQRPYQHNGRHHEVFLAFADSVEYSTFEIDNNIYHHTTSAGSPPTTKPFAIDSTVLLLDEWRDGLKTALAVAYDAHSQQANPKLVTPGAPYSSGFENFMLQSGSPAIGAGLPTMSDLGPDFDGVDSIGCDCGAYNFRSSDPSASTFAGLVAGDEIVCTIPPTQKSIQMWRGDSKIFIFALVDAQNNPIDLSQLTAASWVMQPSAASSSNRVSKSLRSGEIEIYGHPRSGKLKLLVGASDTGQNPGVSVSANSTWYHELQITVDGIDHTISYGQLNIILATT